MYLQSLCFKKDGPVYIGWVQYNSKGLELQLDQRKKRGLICVGSRQHNSVGAGGTEDTWQKKSGGNFVCFHYGPDRLIAIGLLVCLCWILFHTWQFGWLVKYELVQSFGSTRLFKCLIMFSVKSSVKLELINIFS